MLSLHDRASMEHALSLPLEPRLHALLAGHIDALSTEDHDLSDLTHILIIEPGDSQDDMIEAIGFCPTINPIDGAPYGARDFTPCWSWLKQHDGWFEMIVTIGNSGFAFILFIQDASGVDGVLLDLCREYQNS